MSIVLQNIVMPESSGVESAGMYYSATRSHVEHDGLLRVAANDAVILNRYMNLFAIEKWRKYTLCEDFFVRVKASGALTIEVFEYCLVGGARMARLLTRAGLPAEGGEIDVPVPNGTAGDVLYLRLVSANRDVTLESAAFCAVRPREVNESLRVAVCICTFNRPEYLRVTLDRLSRLGTDLSPFLSVVVSNNGGALGFEPPPHCIVLPNRNLGGAGGFTRAAMEALAGGATHVILMDDDIILHPESVYRTISLLRVLKPAYSDCFISGSMLSSYEMWLQYERNTILDGAGFHHLGHHVDLRDPGVALAEASAPAVRGVAGWWYCTIPAMCFRDAGLPLPVFIRGDDVEFGIRCDRDIINLNGICVWHDPFWVKYSELMEDYYLVRNMIFLSFASAREMPRLRKVFLERKFWHNLLGYNYVSAEMNLLALEHFLERTYRRDPEALHREVAAIATKLKAAVRSTDERPWRRPRSRHYRKRTRLLQLLAMGLFPWLGRTGTSRPGFERDPADFVWKRRVVVYADHEKSGVVAEYDARRILSLVRRFRSLRAKLEREDRRHRAEARSFVGAGSTPEAWRSLFEATGSG